MTVVEATMSAELCNSRLPEKLQSLATQKNAATISDLLYLPFQMYLPSERAARVDGLASIEAPVKLSRNFQKLSSTSEHGDSKSSQWLWI